MKQLDERVLELAHARLYGLRVPLIPREVEALTTSTKELMQTLRTVLENEKLRLILQRKNKLPICSRETFDGTIDLELVLDNEGHITLSHDWYGSSKLCSADLETTDGASFVKNILIDKFQLTSDSFVDHLHHALTKW